MAAFVIRLMSNACFAISFLITDSTHLFFFMFVLANRIKMHTRKLTVSQFTCHGILLKVNEFEKVFYLYTSC